MVMQWVAQMDFLIAVALRSADLWQAIEWGWLLKHWLVGLMADVLVVT